MQLFIKCCIKCSHGLHISKWRFDNNFPVSNLDLSPVLSIFSLSVICTLVRSTSFHIPYLSSAYHLKSVILVLFCRFIEVWLRSENRYNIVAEYTQSCLWIIVCLSIHLSIIYYLYLSIYLSIIYLLSMIYHSSSIYISIYLHLAIHRSIHLSSVYLYLYPSSTLDDILAAWW